MEIPLSPAALVLFCLATTCAIISGFLAFHEVGEVNRKLPEDQQFGYYWWYPGKMQKLKAEYRRLYPSGKLERLRMAFQVATVVLAVVFLGLAAAQSGFLKAFPGLWPAKSGMPGAPTGGLP